MLIKLTIALSSALLRLTQCLKKLTQEGKESLHKTQRRDFYNSSVDPVWSHN